jgi:hypothetical protein
LGWPEPFQSVLDPSGSTLLFSTYLGGSSDDYGQGIAVDSVGPYVTGYTNSNNFPISNPLQPANRGGQDAFVVQISP